MSSRRLVGWTCVTYGQKSSMRYARATRNKKDPGELISPAKKKKTYSEEESWGMGLMLSEELEVGVTWKSGHRLEGGSLHFRCDSTQN